MIWSRVTHLPAALWLSSQTCRNSACRCSESAICQFLCCPARVRAAISRSSAGKSVLERLATPNQLEHFAAFCPFRTACLALHRRQNRSPALSLRSPQPHRLQRPTSHLRSRGAGRPTPHPIPAHPVYHILWRFRKPIWASPWRAYNLGSRCPDRRNQQCLRRAWALDLDFPDT